jgi:hypothetical protein
MNKILAFISGGFTYKLNKLQIKASQSEDLQILKKITQKKTATFACKTGMIILVDV